MELGFLHLVLGDELNARRRTFEALELDGQIHASPGAPKKQLDFLAELRRELEARPKLELLPRTGEEPYDEEKTDWGWKTIGKIDAKDTIVSTTCKMQRPS